jgi:hypothetical protein
MSIAAGTNNPDSAVVEIYNSAPAPIPNTTAPATTAVGRSVSAGVEATSSFSSGWIMMWLLGVYYCSTVASINWF